MGEMAAPDQKMAVLGGGVGGVDDGQRGEEDQDVEGAGPVAGEGFGGVELGEGGVEPVGGFVEAFDAQGAGVGVGVGEAACVDDAALAGGEGEVEG